MAESDTAPTFTCGGSAPPLGHDLFGRMLAARAGLLATRRCTTHHELLSALRALAPQAQVVDNRVFVVDGPIASSAGITAGIDLALHLITEECGEALAASVAEDMVVYMRRSSRDPELSPFLVHRRHLHAAVHRVQDAILDKPEYDWDMAALAAIGFATERHLLRLFMDHAGVSPLRYLQSIRLERARQSLERGASVTHAAEIAGFRSSLQPRRAWTRQWGGSPRDVARATELGTSANRMRRATRTVGQPQPADQIAGGKVTRFAPRPCPCFNRGNPPLEEVCRPVPSNRATPRRLCSPASAMVSLKFSWDAAPPRPSSPRPTSFPAGASIRAIRQ